jgi:hypothetical protein
MITYQVQQQLTSNAETLVDLETSVCFRTDEYWGV